jgi:beta-glucosidase
MKRYSASFQLLVVLAVLLVPIACSTPSVSPEGPTAETGAIYRDPQVPVEDRLEDLLERMTLAEKIGQMTQVEKNSISEQDITDLFLGSILSGGGGYPTPNNPQAWAGMVDGFQEYALKTRLGIPLLYGADAVHGHANVRGAVVFPHNIGLGATRDPDLVQRIGRATAEEMAATGVYWNFAPVVAVPQDIRWGRTYEGYSEDTDLVAELSSAYVRGLQGGDGTTDLSSPTTVLATPKHYVGDGGTSWGSSTTFIEQQYMLDQGVTEVDETTLRAIHLPPYAAAIDAGARSIMVSFSSWGGLKLHAHKYLLTDVLKGEMGFDGFLVSDWQGIDQIPGDYDSDVVTAINAGIDMVMVPYDYRTFVKNLTRAVEGGEVSQGRINDAVRRILTVKMELGLFERPYSDESLRTLVATEEHLDLALEAVRKSLVLLKNEDDTLPLAKDTPLIFVAGRGADDIGMQCGGWTIEWQGELGAITPGVTILEGIQNSVSQGATVRYEQSGDFDADEAVADVGIVVVGEMPYAEGVGDRADLSLSTADTASIEAMRAHSKKLVVILLSGRPMIITEQLPLADAWIAAWLPGTEGDGVAQVLFGEYPFTGKLAYTWPRSMDQVPHTRGGDPLFPFGYGLP